MDDQTTIALNRFLIWLEQGRSGERTGVAVVEKATPSASLGLCLFLIFYLSLGDFFAKFLPIDIAVLLRYLPEGLLYLIALAHLRKRRTAGTFPFLWPLCACALSMAISAVLNSVSLSAAFVDFRLYFRFAAFTYIGWKTEMTPPRILHFMKGFLALTVIQLLVGALELLAGESVQEFFLPVSGLLRGDPATARNQILGDQGWLFGTLSNYNNFGMFMAMSCIIALGVYTVTHARAYLALTIACGAAVVLSFSRHSLLVLVCTSIFFYALRSSKNLMKRLMRGIIVGVVLVVTVIAIARVAYPQLEDRLSTLVNPEFMTTDSVKNIRFGILAMLPPRFLTSYPLFGQGPVQEDLHVYGDARDILLAPKLKGAPDLPGIFAFYLGDVFWVMILGLYGCCGLAGFGYLFWTIIKSANRVRDHDPDPVSTMFAQVCLSIIVAFVISGFFSEEIIARDCIPVFWVLAGMTLSMATNAKGEPPTSRSLPWHGNDVMFGTKSNVPH